MTLPEVSHVKTCPRDSPLIEGNEKYIKASNLLFNEFIKLSEEQDRIIGVMIQTKRNFKTTDFVQSDNLIATSFPKDKKAQAS